MVEDHLKPTRIMLIGIGIILIVIPVITMILAVFFFNDNFLFSFGLFAIIFGLTYTSTANDYDVYNFKFTGRHLPIKDPWYVKTKRDDKGNSQKLYLVVAVIGLVACSYLYFQTDPVVWLLEIFIGFGYSGLLIWFGYYTDTLAEETQIKLDIKTNNPFAFYYTGDMIEEFVYILKANKIKMKDDDDHSSYVTLEDKGIRVHFNLPGLEYTDVAVKFNSKASEKDILTAMDLAEKAVYYALNRHEDYRKNYRKYFTGKVGGSRKRVDKKKRSEEKVPSWFTEGSELIYDFDRNYETQLKKELYRMRKNRRGESFIEFGVIFNLPEIPEELRFLQHSEDNFLLRNIFMINDYIEKFPDDIFISRTTGYMTKHPQLIKAGYEYRGTENVNLRIGYYPGVLYIKKGRKDCICTSEENIVGQCTECEGKGKDKDLKTCENCIGSGKCQNCDGRGKTKAIYETSLWYEKRTGIMLKNMVKMDGKIIQKKYLAKVKPRDLFEKNQ